MWDWIGKVVNAAVWPLVKSRVDTLAHTEVMRRAIFAEMIKQRLEQYVHAGKVEQHAALGMAQRIREELGATLSFAETDPAGEEVRRKIVRAVTLKVVPLGTWVVVDQLAAMGKFNSAATASYRFRDASGTQHTGGKLVCAIQSDFLFHKPIALHDLLSVAQTSSSFSQYQTSLGKERSNEAWFVA
jgi:hypothetical protein